MAVETKVGGLIKNGDFEQGDGENAYNWLQETYAPTYTSVMARLSYHYSGSYGMGGVSEASAGWARATSDVFILRAKKIIFYYRWWNGQGDCKNRVQLLLASNNSLLTEANNDGVQPSNWTKGTLDVFSYIGQSVKIRLFTQTNANSFGYGVAWDFIREDIPCWVHKCIGIP